jgi:hypothetical protein
MSGTPYAFYSPIQSEAVAGLRLDGHVSVKGPFGWTTVGSLSPRLTVTRTSMPPRSKQPTEHSESPLAAEEWQLRILRELHKKKPRPTVGQKKLVAAQTGL